MEMVLCKINNIYIYKIDIALIPKKNCAERKEARKILGYFVWKITILRQEIIFFPILGGRARRVRPPPPESAPVNVISLLIF